MFIISWLKNNFTNKKPLLTIVSAMVFKPNIKSR